MLFAVLPVYVSFRAVNETGNAAFTPVDPFKKPKAQNADSFVSL